MVYGINDLMEEAAKAAIKQMLHTGYQGAHEHISNEEINRLAEEAAGRIMSNDDVAVMAAQGDDLKTIAKVVGMAVATGQALVAGSRSYDSHTEGRYEGSV